MTAEFKKRDDALAFALSNGIREDVFESRLECGWSLDRAARQPLKPPASARRRPRVAYVMPPADLVARWEKIAVKCGVRPLNFHAAVKRGEPFYRAAKAHYYEGRLPRERDLPPTVVGESQPLPTLSPRKRRI